MRQPRFVQTEGAVSVLGPKRVQTPGQSERY